MDFSDHIKLLADRTAKLKDNVQTEEATKNALIMPFIQALGYDVFNPMEVVPEFISDIGTKKGEKIDYAIMKDGEPAILIECKHWNQNLDLHDGQLLRYFHVSKARFGILTNGVKYKFYTDLVEKNKMDEKPFMQFDITELKDAHIEELKKFHKTYYDPEQIFNTASDLKFMNELKVLLANELRSPSEKFVRHCASDIYPGRITEKVVVQFTELVKRSFQQMISDMVTERLKTALQKEVAEEASLAEQQAAQRAMEEAATAKTVETTPEEFEAYYIVKAILHPTGYSGRATVKDNLSYCNVLLDNNVRKPIIRFYFNGTKKYVIIFDTSEGTRVDVNGPEDLFAVADKIKTSVNLILGS